MRSGAETRARGFEPCVSDANTETTLLVSSTGRPRKSARSAKAKPIVAAPIASASVATINAEVPGLRCSMRNAVRRSPRMSNHIGALLGYVSDCCGERLGKYLTTSRAVCCQYQRVGNRDTGSGKRE